MSKKRTTAVRVIDNFIYFIYPLDIPLFLSFPEIDFVPPPGEEDKYIMTKV